MNDNIEDLKEKLGRIVKEEFLPHLFARIASHKQFLSELNKLIGEYEDLFINLSSENEFESIKGVIKLKERILEQLDSRFHLADGESLITELDSINIAFSEIIAESEEIQEEVQSKERFYFQQGDSLFFKYLKFVKRHLFNISVIPIRIKNTFRNKTKPSIKINYWKHRIPVRNLRSIYIKSFLYTRLFELYRKTFFEQTASLLALKNYCDGSEKNFRDKHASLNEPEFNLVNSEVSKSQYTEAIGSLDKLKDEFNRVSDEIIEKILDDYSDAYGKAGTIEFTAGNLSGQKVIKSEKDFAKLYHKIHEGWNNTLFALAEDWRLDYELYAVRYKLIYSFIQTTSLISEKLNKNVKPSFNSVIKVIADSRDQVNSFDWTSPNLEKFLSETRNNLRTTLAEKLVPQAIDLLLKQEILINVDDLEDSITKIISGMSDKRALVKTDLYDKEIKESEISYISLRDMLSFSSLPKFKASILKSKAEHSLKLQKIQNNLLEVDQICDFSLDSAQIMLLEKKGNIAEARKVVVEGFDRAIKKMDDITGHLLNINDSIVQKTKEPLSQLNENLIKLTFTESVFELKLKIAKDRTLQKSRELRKEAVNKIKTALPRLFSFLKENYSRFTLFYSKTRKLIGLEKPITSIKGEVANFLSETGESINRLPFVYQRLFAVEPIVDGRFFFGRDKELEKLGIAYKDWTTGKYSPSIIYGEKGSGATSLITIFLKKYNIDYTLIRISLNRTMQFKDDFLNLFDEQLGKSKTTSLKELIAYLNNNTSRKRIIVLENLQQLFLRKINGFENLKILFELMSESNANVFWITTCTVYGYRYLQKTISIADYFANPIELENLDDNQIIEIILKRHRVSGYDLLFEASENIISNKNYQKIPVEEKQVYLEKLYFSQLNKFAHSNISLALLFWVRSTSDITDDKITIGHLPKVDFSFLSTLSNSKIFVLDLLLIHDGLTAEDVTSINGVSADSNRRLLIALEDDGILVRKNMSFFINPLLYRPVVELLKSKNIIH